jgi:hypothetical protein
VGKDAENVGTPHIMKMKIWFIYYKNMRDRNIATMAINGNRACDRLMNGRTYAERWWNDTDRRKPN